MNKEDLQPNFVKKKIREQAAVARARKEPWPATLAKVVKKAISISELLTEEDLRENARVLRQAKRATHRIFDPEKRKMIQVPDHKTRLAAITLELAYSEGRPIERQIQLQAKFEDLGEVLAQVRESPETMKMLAKLGQPVIDVESEGA